MRYIIKPDGKILKWVQPKAMVRYHELRSDGALYATLKWKRMFGSLAVGETREWKFTFKRAGFLRPYVTARREGFGGDYATLRFASGSIIVNSVFGPNGVMETESGEKYLFTRLSFWKSRWAFTDREGNLLVTFDKGSRGKPTSVVTINADLDLLPHIDLLLLIGWYVIILDYEETEANVGTGQYASTSNSA